MGTMASQITSLTIVYSTISWVEDQREHQSSASLAFVRGIHRGPVNSPAQMASNADNVSIRWRHHVHRKWRHGMIALMRFSNPKVHVYMYNSVYI